MDSPNNGPGDGSSRGGQQQPANQTEYTRQVRQAMDDRRRNVTQKLNQFRPHVHDQMNRLFGSYEAPLYARLRGFTSSRTVALTESSITALAAGTNRHFEDPEAQALGEYIITGLNRNVMFKWALTGFAGFMTWRGRKTFRLPFISPQAGGLLCPYAGGPAVKMGWHVVRFVSYNIFAWIAVEPVFQIANMMNQKSAMMSDPRLRNIMKESQSKQGSAFGQAQDAGSWEQESQSDYSQQQQQQQSSAGQTYSQTPQSYSQPSQPQEQEQQPSWSSYSQQTTYQPQQQQQQQQQQNDAWGSSSVDDFDDASPVAAQNGPGQGGSAWDRVRQQSQPSQRRQQPRYQPQQPQQWGQQQQQNEWGNVDDASPQRRPASESYTFSAADGERAEAKSQAQREFDALVERERYGEDQKSSGWGRK